METKETKGNEGGRRGKGRRGAGEFVFEPTGLNFVGLPNIATRRLCLLALPRQNGARHIADG